MTGLKPARKDRSPPVSETRSPPRRLRMVLTATTAPDCSSTALRTSPISPRPSRPRILNRPPISPESPITHPPASRYRKATHHYIASRVNAHSDLYRLFLQVTQVNLLLVLTIATSSRSVTGHPSNAGVSLYAAPSLPVMSAMLPNVNYDAAASAYFSIGSGQVLLAISQRPEQAARQRPAYGRPKILCVPIRRQTTCILPGLTSIPNWNVARPSGAQVSSQMSSCPCIFLTRRPLRKPVPATRSATKIATAARNALR